MLELNFTKDAYFDKFWLQYLPFSRDKHLVILISYLLIGVFGVIANLVAIVYYIFFENLQKSSNYLILNLAVSDLFILLSNCPMVVISSYYEKWIFGRIGCDVYGVVSGASGFSSIASLAWMSVEKCKLINKPFRRFNITHRVRKIFFVIILIWIYAVMWVLPPLLSENGFVLEGLLTSCSFDYFTRTKPARIFNFLMIFGGFLTPLTAIIISYTIILRKLRARSTSFFRRNSHMRTDTLLKDFCQFTVTTHQPTRESREPEEAVFSSPELSTQGSQERHQSNRACPKCSDRSGTRRRYLRKRYPGLPIDLLLDSEKKAIKNGLFSVLFFCMAWLPYAFVCFSAQYLPNPGIIINPYTTSLPALFAKTSACINPCINTILNPSFRSKIRLFRR